MAGRMPSIKTVWVFANLVCTVVLAIQLVNVLESYIQPTITRTWEEEVPLEDIEFPLVIKICTVPGFNQTALHEAASSSADMIFRSVRVSLHRGVLFLGSDGYRPFSDPLSHPEAA